MSLEGIYYIIIETSDNADQTVNGSVMDEWMISAGS